MSLTIVVASHNRKKSGEMIAILTELLDSPNISLLADFEGAPEPEETGQTFQENAAIKARACAQFTGLLSIADDAGLVVDALGGAPGLYSKRFGGEETSFGEKMALILEEMKEVAEPDRAARFQCAVAIAWPDGRLESVETTCEGLIAQAPRGTYGFGYDPIFFLPELGCTMAELPPEFKNRISHRAKALKLASEILQSQV
ncbi:MAG: RdgB/HAM1 family non-canonical purine NTP pyrophosphatase [Armatimonadetes bacterium]|nr:RdgB/HAM1 family non-canonical purine NTP pyrophosphatase [Armatimonadota bacterium]